MSDKIIIPIHLHGDTYEKIGRLEDIHLGAAGNYGIYRLKVTADHEWDGLTIKVVWQVGEGEGIETVLFNGLADVPAEATAEEVTGRVVTFVGVDGFSQRKISVEMKYSVDSAGPIEGKRPAQPTPDVVDQILAKAGKAEQQAMEAVVQATEANKKSENAEPYAKVAKDAAAQAQTNALEAIRHNDAIRILTDQVRADAATTAQLSKDFRTIAVIEQESVQQIGADERHALTDLADQKSGALDLQASKAIASVKAHAQAAAGSAEAAGASAQTAGQHKLAAEAAKTRAESAQQAAEAGAARAEAMLDDSIVTDEKGWSSSKIRDYAIEAFCPPFAGSGPIVAGKLFQDSKINLTLDFEPIQKGKGDPSPDNVRPVKARNVVNGIHCGRNILKVNEIFETINGVTLTSNADGSIHVSGTATKRTEPVIATTFYIPEGDYSSSLDAYLILLTSIGYQTIQANGKNHIKASTVYSAYMRFEPGEIEERDIFPQLELISPAHTPYTPYHAKPFTVQLGQGVYWGKCDGKKSYNYGLVLSSGNWSSEWQKNDEYPTIRFAKKYHEKPCDNDSLMCLSDFAKAFSGSLMASAAYKYVRDNPSQIAIFNENAEYCQIVVSAEYAATHTPQQTAELGTIIVKTKLPVSEAQSRIPELRAFGNGDTAYTEDPACTLNMTGYKDHKTEVQILSDRVAVLEGASTNL